MIKLCRFYLPNKSSRLGQLVDDKIYDLSASGLSSFKTLSSLLKTSQITPLAKLLQTISLEDLPSYNYKVLNITPNIEKPYLLSPVDRQEVWAAGVTYSWSREARVREAHIKDIYIEAYEADRPELFFKSLGEKVVGPNDWVGLRGDSQWNVPEPELTLVLNPAMQIIGYTIGNDVSSRDIEGKNPLYLPQAKIYRHSCAIGPVITINDKSFDTNHLTIKLIINRNSKKVFEGKTTTAKINRSMTELMEYLGCYNDFPNGVMLMTGTGIVPDDNFTLCDKDEVFIEIESIGTLYNPVKQM